MHSSSGLLKDTLNSPSGAAGVLNFANTFIYPFALSCSTRSQEGWSLFQLSMGKRRCTPRTGRQSITAVQLNNEIIFHTAGPNTVWSKKYKTTLHRVKVRHHVLLGSVEILENNSSSHLLPIDHHLLYCDYY